MDTDFCIDALEEALARHEAPEIFNTDQGCQSTSQAFTEILEAHDVRISMDGKGCYLNNLFMERLCGFCEPRFETSIMAKLGDSGRAPLAAKPDAGMGAFDACHTQG